MKYFNLDLTVLRSPEYIGADPVQRATWLSLMGWCCELENGGVIEACLDWGARRWMQSCGVTLDEVLSDCPLWSWDGNDLILTFYPEEQEAIVRQNRINGAKGGRPKKSVNQVVSVNENQSVIECKNQSVNQTGNQVAKRKEKESKEKESKEKESKEKNNGVSKGTHAYWVEPTVKNVMDAMANPSMPFAEDNLSEVAESFINYYSALGWTIRGNPIVDWIGLAKNYASRRWKELAAKHVNDHKQSAGKPKKKKDEDYDF